MNPNDAARGHPSDLLAALAAGTLPPDQAARVEAHVARCAACATEARAWAATAGAAHARAARLPEPADLAPCVLAAVTAAGSRPPSLRRRYRWLGRFVLGQLPIVRREIWPASVVVMGIGAALSLLPPHGVAGTAAPGAGLALFAPFAAALGVALVYGVNNDPSLEIALSTPTSPRLVVLARLVVVLAYDLVLALAVSALLVVVHGPAVAMPIVGLWLGPMLLVGSLSLVLSLVVGTTAAIGVGGLLWALRALELGDPNLRNVVDGLPAVLDAIWQTSPLTLALALALVLVALAVAPRIERVGAAGSAATS